MFLKMVDTLKRCQVVRKYVKIIDARKLRATWRLDDFDVQELVRRGKVVVL